MFLAGILFAPTMTLVMTLIERTVPPSGPTEGMARALTGLTTGTALGTFSSGLAVEESGTSGGFLVAVAAGALRLLPAPVFAPLLGRVRERFPRAGEERDSEETAGAAEGAGRAPRHRPSRTGRRSVEAVGRTPPEG